jgi:RimJ/RimL family protein N-acetyltransferase
LQPALELLELQIETLFEFDARGRMIGKRAPRIYLGRTLEGQRLRLGAGLSDATAAELEAIAARELRIVDLREPPPPAEEFRAALGAIQTEYRGPAFWLPAKCDEPRTARLVTRDNVDHLAGPFDWLARELDEVSPAVVSLEQGAAVSVCHCAARGPRAAEAGIETQEPARGRGHARRAVAAWAAHVRAAGLRPLYSTQWNNKASRALAASLGAVAYAEDFHLT